MKPSPIDRAKGALLAAALGLAGAAWVFGWGSEPCYRVADQQVCGASK